MKDKKQQKAGNINIVNRKARHEYHIEDTYEAGIVLTGTEIKSIRLGKASIQEAYCKVEDSEVLIVGMHIAPYEQGNRFNQDPLRTRKLLLHRAEINKIDRATKEKGLTLVPLKLYFSRGYAKLSIGIGRGKRLWDKRESIAQRDAEREQRHAQTQE